MRSHFPSTGSSQLRLETGGRPDVSGASKISKSPPKELPELPELPRSSLSPESKAAEQTGLIARVLGSGGKKALLCGAVAVVSIASTVGYLAPDAEPVKGAPLDLNPTGESGTEVSMVAQALEQVAKALEPFGISHEEARSSLTSISASVAIEDGSTKSVEDGVEIKIDPNTRVWASLDKQGFRLSMEPGLHRVVNWGLDSEINSLSYRFSDATFYADAEGFGPDSWHSDGVASSTNKFVAPLLPEAMRQPGYSPTKDGNIVENFQSIIDLLKPASSGAGVGSTSLSAPALFVELHVPKDLTIPLGEDGVVARVAKGTRITVSASFDGPIDDFVLRSLNVRIANAPIEINKGSERKLLARLDLDGVTLRPNGELELDYDLGGENLVDGLKALFVLTATAADPRLAHTATISRTRMEGPRKEIAEKVDDKVEPVLRELIRRHDQSIKGLSLEKVFGVSPDGP